RRGRVTALREPALRLVRRGRVVRVDVEQAAGGGRVALRVQRVARVLDERDLVLRDEGDVVEAGVRRVALVEERERAGVRRRGLLAQLEDRAPAADRVFHARGVRVARLVEVELPELAVGPEGVVLRPLERRTVGRG